MEIKKIINKSIDVKNNLLQDDITIEKITEAVNTIVNSFRDGNKVLFCGNGGSAADAQHLAAELSGRFYFDRDPLPSEALHVNTSYITAVANDYSYEQIYSRYIKGVGKNGDVLVGLSTSGKSKNVIKAFEMAKSIGMICIGLTGDHMVDFKQYCDIVISVPSSDTPRIQECHIMIGHIICELVEKEYFNTSK